MNSVLPFLKGKKAAVQHKQKQSGTFDILHMEAINFNKAEINSEHRQPSHFGFMIFAGVYVFFFST